MYSGAMVYAHDSTTPDLCMTLFPWAHFRRAGSGFSDQRLFTVGSDRSRDLQGTLVNRTLFKRDQAAPAYQGLLWNQRECGQNTYMDCHLCLPARSDHEKAAKNRAIALRNFTDFESVRFR